MAYNIHQACEKSFKMVNEARDAHEFVTNYCSKVAQELSGDEGYEFDSLPEELVDTVINGIYRPEEKWKPFIYRTVRDHLIRNRVIDA